MVAGGLWLAALARYTGEELTMHELRYLCGRCADPVVIKALLIILGLAALVLGIGAPDASGLPINPP